MGLVHHEVLPVDLAQHGAVLHDDLIGGHQRVELGHRLIYKVTALVAIVKLKKIH